MANVPDLQFHHVGCVVRSIDAALKDYAGTVLEKPVAEPVRVLSQKVRVCFLPTSTETFVELVEPEQDNRYLNRLLDRGVTFYHIGFLCRSVEASERAFTQNGARVFDRFHSEAFEGRLCVFLFTAKGQMIELTERS